MSRAWQNWRSAVEFSPSGPGITVSRESIELKVVLVALGSRAGAAVAPGPGRLLHILDGTGSVLVDDDPTSVTAGVTVVVRSGSWRAVRGGTPRVPGQLG